MNDTERAALERLAGTFLNHDQETVVGISALAAEGYDTGLLLELIAAYARLPQAKQKYEFRVDGSGRPRDFTLEVKRR